MIFSVQNSNLMYSVEFSPDLVQIQVRETVSGVFLARMDIPMQVCDMVEVMRRDPLQSNLLTSFTSNKSSATTLSLLKNWLLIAL